MSPRRIVAIGGACVGAAAVAIWVAIAVSRPPAPFGPPGDLAGEAGDICEAVLRYQFDNNASAAQRQGAEGFYIVIHGHEELGAFLDRFKDETVSVREGRWVWRNVPGRIFFRVDSLAFDSSSRARAEGGYYEGPLSASGCTYYLRRVSGRWVVIRHELEWIA